MRAVQLLSAMSMQRLTNILGTRRRRFRILIVLCIFIAALLIWWLSTKAPVCSATFPTDTSIIVLWTDWFSQRDGFWEGYRMENCDFHIAQGELQALSHETLNYSCTKVLFSGNVRII
jgi:hypothetical protein